ncbi:TonB-dependent receptor [Neiella marina]|uniref:TonB-dependent receptor n=1 Tax=Neiella marina TaxID=508461 RepID=A0A8J2U2R9_9GAMM|nr:TonB-dependent receptor [Neiella marina]GGA68240.1 TonB-dependent receptor [Neiella marina]
MVLINGRRVQVSSFANESDSFIDINAIPLAAVERIEVLMDGSSALYGADAVAGVVNFIMKRNYEGVELSGSYSQTTQDDDYGKTNLNAVVGFSYGESNTTLVFDYFDRDALMHEDRKRTRDATFWLDTAIDVDYSDYPDPWDCPEEDVVDTKYGQGCFYNYVQYRATIPDRESLGVYLFNDTRLSDNTAMFVELAYQHNESQSYDAPSSISGFSIPWDHPDMPQYYADINAEDGYPDDDLTTYTRFPDRRQKEAELDAYRAVLGFNGELSDWYWETAASYGYSENTIKAVGGYYHEDKVQAALRGELCADGSIDCSPDSGGLWYNPFNRGADADRAVIELMEERAPRKGESTMYAFDAKVSGDVWQLPAGMLSMAAGAEYRYEEIEDKPDQLAQDGKIINLGVTEAKADRYQWSAFAEFYVPVTDNFDAQLALRYDDYEDAGDDFNPKIGLRYLPFENLVLRASYGTSFRAPSLSQTGAGITEGEGYLPCDNEYEALCSDDSIDVGEVEYDRVFGGNPNLQPETADTYNLGLSWDVTKNLNVTLDYWSYDYEDLIDVDEDFILQAYLRGELDAKAPGELVEGEVGLEINSDGDLHKVQNSYINIGKQEVEGFDIGITYGLETDGWGDFELLVDATYLDNYKRWLTSDSEPEQLAGDWTYPEWIALSTLRWDYKQWRVSLTGDYTDSYNDGPYQYDDHPTVDSWLVWHSNVTYYIGDDYDVSLTVRNIANDAPPMATSPTAGVDFINHDTLGRYWTLAFSARF